MSDEHSPAEPTPEGGGEGHAAGPGPTRPAQIFAPGADAVFRLALMVVVVGIVMALGGLYGVTNSNYLTNVGIVQAQPVPFSHKHHAGELGLDCRFCHTAVETQASAGMPPTYTCMTCHSQIWTGAPMLAPVRASFARNEPIRWTRVTRIPDYVYFDHAIHIAKGIGCSTCHGAVDQMQLTATAHAFRMQFCVNCHRDPAPHLRPQAEIWNMAWTPPPQQASLGPALMHQYHIDDTARLTDCSTCHR